MREGTSVMGHDRKRDNIRTGILLGLLAFAFFLGFLAKVYFLR